MNEIKIIGLDLYPNSNYRISKDTNGGYGTSNIIKGVNLNIINKAFKINQFTSIDLIYLLTIFSKLNNVQIEYHRINDLDSLPKGDIYFYNISIVAHEFELEYYKRNLINKEVFIVGSWSNVAKKFYDSKNTYFFPSPVESISTSDEDLKKILNNKDFILKEEFTDLDNNPLPDWSLINKEFRPTHLLSGISQNIIPIRTSIGCPYSCSYYCTYPLQQGKKVISYNAENLIFKMLDLSKKMQTKWFLFRDPVFGINPKQRLEILKVLGKSDFKIILETHLRLINLDEIKLFKEAGVKCIYVGIESADNEVLKDSKRKNEKENLIYEKIKKIEKNGIFVKGMYIIGLPADTKKSIIKTINYSKTLPHSMAQFSVFTAYPGTQAYNDMINDVSEQKYYNFNQWTPTVNHSNLSKLEISNYLNRSYIEFYLYRPIKSFILTFRIVLNWLY